MAEGGGVNLVTALAVVMAVLPMSAGTISVPASYLRERRGLRAVELPDDSNLSNKISCARTFVDFALRGDGHRILESAGSRYFAHPQIVSTR